MERWAWRLQIWRWHFSTRNLSLPVGAGREWIPTLVTTSVENMQRSLSIIADFIQAQKPTEQLAAQILGYI